MVHPILMPSDPDGTVSHKHKHKHNTTQPIRTLVISRSELIVAMDGSILFSFSIIIIQFNHRHIIIDVCSMYCSKNIEMRDDNDDNDDNDDVACCFSSSIV